MTSHCCKDAVDGDGEDVGGTGLEGIKSLVSEHE